MLVSVQDSADSMAADSSSLELVKVRPFVLMVVTTGWRGDPLVTNAAAPQFLVPPLADPSV